jgi:glycosyltransferase involved in cell wall biosynthesis
VKIAAVVPRYGLEVIGGCETAVRELSEWLARCTDVEVEVLTTTAADSTTWDEYFPAGATQEAGVTVHRFPVASGRARDCDARSAPLMARARSLSPAEQQAWLTLQGPVSPTLVAAVAGTAAEVVAIHPYLFWPGVAAHAAARVPVVFHPYAHDEAPLRLSMYAPLFEASAGLVFQVDAERRLCERRFAIAPRRTLTLGLGVEAQAGAAPDALAAVGVGDRPYLLCLGRVDDGKGARLLFEWFAAYKERHPGPLTLVYAGQVVHPLPAHPDVVVVGLVDEPVKWGLLRGTVALVSPSANESFSLVVLEAWVAGVPVVVNGRCAVTREHCERSGGGLWFDGYAQFEAVVDRLVADDDLRAALAARGAAYVDRSYRWPALAQRFAAFLDLIVARGVDRVSSIPTSPASPSSPS